MENVSFRRRGSQFLSLEVLGLAERRPSLVYGDSIFAKLASEPSPLFALLGFGAALRAFCGSWNGPLLGPQSCSSRGFTLLPP